MKIKYSKNMFILLLFLAFGCAAQKTINPTKHTTSDVTAYISERGNSRLTAYSPPRIPHEIYEDSCLDCHLTNETDAPMMPHKNIINCRQCHVPQEDVPLFMENDFGVPEAKRLPLAYKNSPPAIPHHIFMREKCLACHGVDSRPDVINTRHPERINCRQCHVPSAM